MLHTHTNFYLLHYRCLGFYVISFGNNINFCSAFFLLSVCFFWVVVLLLFMCLFDFFILQYLHWFVFINVQLYLEIVRYFVSPPWEWDQHLFFHSLTNLIVRSILTLRRQHLLFFNLLSLEMLKISKFTYYVSD